MRRLFALVAAVILVDMSFYAAITPLLAQYVEDLGISKSAAGVLSASYAAGTLLAALPCGWLAARLGVRATMLTGLALLGAASIVFAFGTDVVVLDTARFVQGVGGACSWTAGLTWLLGRAPRERRGEVLGAVLSVAIGGLLLGPVVGSLATVLGPEPVFASFAVLAAALAIWALTTSPVIPTDPPSVRVVIAGVLSAPVLGAVWLVALPSLLAGVLDVLVPLRLDALGAGGLAIGAAFLAAAAVEGGMSPFVGRLSDRVGRFVPIRVGLGAGAGLALVLALPEAIGLLALVVVIVVVALSLLWTPAMALLSERAEAAGIELAFGAALTNLAWAGGQVIGGALGPAIADASSDLVAYAAIAALFALTLGVLIAARPARAVTAAAVGE